MPELSVPSGQDEIKLALPDHWTVQQVATSSLPAAPDDWADDLARALNQPDSGPPLRRLLGDCRRGRIVLIVEDLTRHSPLAEILRVVMREIDHAGIERDQLEIVLATGMHPAADPERVDEKLGPAVEGIRRRCNPWQDRGAYLSLGRVGKIDLHVDRDVATADLRILISSVSAHLQAGFGGGYKMVFPGCSHLDTIRPLHQLGVGRRPRQLVGTDATCNPMRATIDAAGRKLEAAGHRTFAVQYVLDATHQPSYIATGDVIPAQRMMAKQCSVACGVVTPAPADVLITSAYPRDRDLWQSFKSIANTCWAVRPNGIILCLTRCEAGMEGMDVPRWPLGPTWTRRILRLLGPDSLCSLITRLMPHLAADAGFFIRMAAQTLHRNPVLVVSPALANLPRPFPGLQTFAAPGDAFAAADAMLKGDSRRVTIFPAGGITFPIPTPRPANGASGGIGP